jgi:REP element-mobilizing transposase RayT
MPVPFSELYVHVVWATRDRLPYVTADLEAQVFGAIASQCRLLNAQAIAVGGTDDHVHVLVRLPPRLAVTTLVEAAKAASQEAVLTRARPGWQFEWAATFGAASLGVEVVPRGIHYVREQRALHAANNLWEAWERCDAPDPEPRPFEQR